MKNYINNKATLFDITEKYPETIDIFVSKGFTQMDDPAQRESFGKLITLDVALSMKKLNAEIFTNLLNEAISENREGSDATLNKKVREERQESLNVVGLLPCPVRIPLLEEYNKFTETYENDQAITVNAELKAASVGTQWVEENIDGTDSIDELPDLFISAGFDLFFDKKRIGKYREAGEFADLLEWQNINPTFAAYELNDPDRNYSIISVVPAVFLVNRNELGDRPVPRSWADIINGDFEDSVSLPVGDFDLFNAILLSLRQKYGDEAVTKLGKAMLQSMHPSQMVKSDRMKTKRPTVTIMPYFFTKTVKEGGAMIAVWPEDGAVLSPIFMLAKKKKSDKLKPIVNFFASKAVGEVLAHQGLFPSLNPDVDNRLDGEKPFMWVGWDFIKQHDLSKEIAICEGLFNKAVEEK